MVLLRDGKQQHSTKGYTMTLALPGRLSICRKEIGDHVATFTHQQRKFRHVWMWDTLNNALTYTQIRRFTNCVRVRRWKSGPMMLDLRAAFAYLREQNKGNPLWLGRDAIDQLQKAFVRRAY